MTESIRSVGAAEISVVLFVLALSGGLTYLLARRFPLRAPAGPREPPLWGVAEILLAIGCLILAELPVFLLVESLPQPVPTGYVLSFDIIVKCAVCAGIAYWIRQTVGQPLATLGVRGTSLTNVAFLAVLSIPVRFFIGAVALLWQVLLFHGLGLEPEQQEVVTIIAEELRENRHGSVALLVLGGTLLAPIWEEFFFRGLVFGWLEQRLGFLVGAVLSGLLFAAVHRSPDALVPLWILGILLAWLYSRSRSLLVPILFHAVFNSITMLLLLLTGGEI